MNYIHPDQHPVQSNVELHSEIKIILFMYFSANLHPDICVKDGSLVILDFVSNNLHVAILCIWNTSFINYFIAGQYTFGTY